MESRRFFFRVSIGLGIPNNEVANGEPWLNCEGRASPWDMWKKQNGDTFFTRKNDETNRHEQFRIVDAHVQS